MLIRMQPCSIASSSESTTATASGSKDETPFTPKVGLTYQVTPDVFTYASISTGFDAGGFNNRASSLATALPYNEENVTLYEAGLKSDWFNHHLRANATLFYNDYQNLQETAAVISPVTSRAGVTSKA